MSQYWIDQVDVLDPFAPVPRLEQSVEACMKTAKDVQQGKLSEPTGALRGMLILSRGLFHVCSMSGEGWRMRPVQSFSSERDEATKL